MKDRRYRAGIAGLVGLMLLAGSGPCGPEARAQKVMPGKAPMERHEASGKADMPGQEQVSLPVLRPNIEDFPDGYFKARKELLRFDVMMLAGDSMQGRLTGSPQDLEAAHYIARIFMRELLLPFGKDTVAEEPGRDASDYFQEYGFQARWGEWVRSRNVVGVVPGTDTALSDRFVVVGAHFDHIGWGDKTGTSMRAGEPAIHNGADDNASGVAMLLELARYYSRNPLRKTLVFVAFSGEEVGMTGSSFFLKEFPCDRKRIDAMFNLDMLGGLHGDRFRINGVGTSAEAMDMVKEAQQHTRLKLEVSANGYGPSDHAVFYAAGIPVFFFCTSPTATYHTPDDDPGTLDYEGMVALSEVIGNLLGQAGNSGPLHFRQAGPPEQPSMGKGKFKATLGLMPDINNSSEKGLAAMIVVEGKPAYRAGLRSGDILLKVAGRKVSSIEDYMEVLSGLEPGTEIAVQAIRKRDGKKVKLTVRL